jgi:AAA domain
MDDRGGQQVAAPKIITALDILPEAVADRTVPAPAAPSSLSDTSVLEMPWYTPGELSQLAGAEPRWFIEGLIPCGAITELSAKPKVGKTRWILDAVAASQADRPFLGRSTRQLKVAYMTEEGASTFLHALKRAELLVSPGITVLLRSKAMGRQWRDIVAGAAAKCVEFGAEVLVVDTLTDWAGIRGEEENSSGAALEAMEPLREVANTGVGVIVLRHDRKSGGRVGESGRGSSAFAGAADVLLSLKFPQTNGHPTRRILESAGRYDGLPGSLTLDLRDGRYACLGEGIAIDLTDAKDRALRALTEARGVMTEAELLDVLGSGPQKLSRSTLKRALAALSEDSLIETSTGVGPNKRATGYRVVDDVST